MCYGKLRARTILLTTLMAILQVASVHADISSNLENWYDFDNDQDPGADISGNERNGTVDTEWVLDPDPARRGVLEFESGNNGLMRAEVPTLPADGFTIAFWAYRNPDTSSAGNDGLFQIQAGGQVPGGAAAKTIGGWVAGTRGVWGRTINDSGTRVNLARDVFFMPDNEWTHFTYRGDGSTFEVLINGENANTPSESYDGTLQTHDTLFVGKQGTESWGGRIDDFRVYSRALTPADIFELVLGEPLPNPGDFNGDGQVDLADYSILLENFHTTGDVTFSLGDNNLDRRVDLQDFVEFRQIFAAGQVAAAVPEPTSLGQVLLSLFGILQLARLRKPR